MFKTPNFIGRTFFKTCALTCAFTAIASAQTHEVVLHSFGCPPNGSHPSAGVVLDSAGNIYGTTTDGGVSGVGVVFKLDTAGSQTVLHSFTGGPDGGYPESGVIRDSAGSLYGTTERGGASDAGVVFQLSAAGKEKVLYNFSGGTDGGYPDGGVIRDSAGNLYGTAAGGGASGYGVVFKLSPAGAETVLYSFTGGADGGVPYAGVIRDSSGNFYGTTEYGGIASGYAGAGVVYKLSPAGAETVPYTFTGGADGANPVGGVVLDSAGNLYGTTNWGGTGAFYAGFGVAFEVDSAGHETVLHTFTNGADGGNPFAGLVRDSSGNLYGTTQSGGSGTWGVVFELNSAGQETELYSFTLGADGQLPAAGLTRDSAGNLYGATQYGGTGAGVVFKLATNGQEKVLYTFPNSTDGYLPFAGLARDSAGNLYGTTYYGGAPGAGVVFKVSSAGEETILHTFAATAADGGFPGAPVIVDSSGNLYGTTIWSGPGGWGTVYELDPAGEETVLHGFAPGNGGDNPYGTLTRDSAGDLYGTTPFGGASSAGVVFELDTSGIETVLYTFTGGADGGNPFGGVIRDSAGNLYGTTQSGGASSAGAVFKIDTSGQETVLYSFTGGNDGGYPTAGVIQDSAGRLYGTTQSGGASYAGVVFEVSAAGVEKVLYTFTGGTDGGDPSGGVVRDSAGNLYGTTAGGGASYAGVVFKLSPSGVETVLYSFTGGADGGTPTGGVIRDSGGNLYGNTESGGKRHSGVVFELKP